MPKRQFEFTLILSGVTKLEDPVLDALYDAGCDDALIGTRDGVAFADFAREARSLAEAIQSAIRDVEKAGVGAKVEHIEPEDLVTMSEMARRLGMTREGVRKWIVGDRGPGDFPVPVAGLKQRSPLWRWTDVLRWHSEQGLGEGGRADATKLKLAEDIAAYNAALALRRRVPLREGVRILQALAGPP